MVTMSLKFQWRSKSNGERLAKIQIAFFVNRQDLVEAAAEWFEFEQERSKTKTPTRIDIERKVRFKFGSYGDMSDTSSVEEIVWDDEGVKVRNPIWDDAETIIDTLFPEVTT